MKAMRAIDTIIGFTSRLAPCKAVDNPRVHIRDDGYLLTSKTIPPALNEPNKINRYGVLCLGLSDDAVDEVSLLVNPGGKWHPLLPHDRGSIELPVWVDHVGAANTRWQRFNFDEDANVFSQVPGSDQWKWIEITAPN